MGLQDMVNEIMEDEVTRKGFLKENPLSTKQHPHADILRAIADGKEIQYQDDASNEWHSFDPSQEMSLLNQNSYVMLRIKPEVKTGWVGIMKSSSDHAPVTNIYPTKERLFGAHTAGQLQAIKEITYTPGEGL
jgi:hypothetical protein